MPYKPTSKKSIESKKILNREYNCRRPQRHKVYNTTRWQKLRAYKKQRDPLCEECLRHGKLTPANLVDHIVPIEAGGAIFDLTNLQSLCSACHNAKHKGEGGKKSLDVTQATTARQSSVYTPIITEFRGANDGNQR